VRDAEINGSLVRFRSSSRDVRLRLCCFPYAGGSAWIHRQWTEWLPIGVEVAAIQLPGRGHRASEPPYVRLQPLLDELEGTLIPYDDVPFAFFGHSLGSLIAFELARRLASYGSGPAHLFVSGRPAPGTPRRRPAIHELPDREFLEQVGRFNGLPAAVLANVELRELLLPVLRADFTVSETHHHVPGPRLSCPISAFGGDGDEDVTRHDLERWAEQTNSACTIEIFPGDHFFIHTAERSLLARLSESLRGIVDELATHRSR
jgi:medium-chain acyl-[acyl-carrier-protein] hydrolase